MYSTNVDFYGARLKLESRVGKCDVTRDCQDVSEGNRRLHCKLWKNFIQSEERVQSTMMLRMLKRLPTVLAVGSVEDGSWKWWDRNRRVGGKTRVTLSDDMGGIAEVTWQGKKCICRPEGSLNWERKSCGFSQEVGMVGVRQGTKSMDALRPSGPSSWQR